MAENKQTVVADTNAEATPSVEGKDAQDKNPAADLEALLSQYDESVAASRKPAATEDKTATPTKLPELKPEQTTEILTAAQELILENRQRKENESKAAMKQAIEDAAKAVKGELPDSLLSLKEARAWLKDEADEDPRITEAFLDRVKNPDKWNQILKGMNDKLTKEKKRAQVDESVTGDREAVSAAVRGASTQPPPAKEPNISHVSDNDLRSQVEQKYGYRPNF